MSLARQGWIVCLLTCLAAWSATLGSDQRPDRSAARFGHANSRLTFRRPPVITLGTDPRVPMAALIEFSTNRPVWVSMDLSDGTRSRRVAYGRQPSRNFTVPILGLSPGKRHQVHLTVTDVYGNSVTWTEAVEVETAPLPDDFPLLRVKISVPDEMEPGVTLFSAVPYEGGAFSFLIAVDEEGEVVWYYRADHVIGYVTQLRNGNLLYLYRAGAIEYRAGAVEIDWLGNMLRHWIPASLASPVAAGDIPVSADSFHHDMQELPNGNLLGLSTELRQVYQYPSSEADPISSRGNGPRRW